MEPVVNPDVNNVQPLKEVPFDDKLWTISIIALSIIAGTACFAALPFVSGVGAPVGLILTGIFCLTIGAYKMLSGDGLVMFKSWAKERKVEADKEKSKNVQVEELNEKQVVESSDSGRL